MSFLFPVLGYLFGSLPFSIWVTRFVRGVDVRDAGSGHATTTNTIRQAGFGWGALVLVLDLAKGFIPIYLALLVVRDIISYYVIPLPAPTQQSPDLRLKLEAESRGLFFTLRPVMDFVP